MSETKVGTACARERLPEHLETLREIARQAISPLKPADESAVGRLFFTARRTKAGRDLPPYYLVYFPSRVAGAKAIISPHYRTFLGREAKDWVVAGRSANRN